MIRKILSGVFYIVSAAIFISCASTTSNISEPANIYYVYATAESEDEVSLIKFDGKKAEVEKDIAVGVWPVEIEGPHGITVSPDGKHWYLSMAHGFPYGHVYKYATGTDEMLGRVELDLFPATMQISPTTGLLYVVNFNLHGDHVPSSVSIVDPESLEEIDRVTTGVMPHGSRISPDGLRHYSVAMMDDKLYEIDAVSLEVSRTLNLNKEVMGGMQHHAGMQHGKKGGMKHQPVSKPTWVYPHPTKPFVYVANNGNAEVAEVDLNEWKVARRFSTDKGPYNLEVSQDGKILVVSYKSAGSTGVWDLASGTELAKFPNSRKVTHGVSLSPDSRYAFVTAEGIGAEAGVVDVFDLKTLKHVSTAEIGKQAGGIIFWKMEAGE